MVCTCAGVGTVRDHVSSDNVETRDGLQQEALSGYSRDGKGWVVKRSMTECEKSENTQSLQRDKGDSPFR
jgi:hypothetical protein